MTDKTSNATASASVAFPVASLAVFTLLIMKLADIQGLGDLSWWWVFSPWLISLAVFFGVLLILGAIAGTVFGVASIQDKRNAKKREQARAERLRR